MRGFESYNKFKTNIKDLRQIYDITYHLYNVEKNRLQTELKNNGNINFSIKTSVGSVEHSPTALYHRLENLYPFKLRQLILISSVTSLEVYLTDVILEIFERDITPFKINEPITFQKNYLLSESNINNIQLEIITKDFRNLTSGGLKEIEKYYNKMFTIDLKNLGVSFQDIEEIHIRRHLFVHRNGITDSNYVSRFPHMGYKVSKRIMIGHTYLIDSLNKITKFAELINKEVLKKYPDIKRSPKYYYGIKSFSPTEKNLLIELSLFDEKFDHVLYLNNLSVKGVKLADFIVQMTTIDKTCLLFLSGNQSDLSPFFKSIIDHENMTINKTIEIKNNECS